MKPIDLIIFDLDGTLIDSKADLVNSVNFTIGKLGFPQKDTELIAKCIGNGVVRLIKSSTGIDDVKLLNKAVEIFLNHYKEHLLDNTLLFQGVRETLKHFKNKAKAVITNKNTELSNMILKGLGVDNEFNCILGRDKVAEGKPSPLGVLEILKMFKIDKSKALIVGDMSIDIQTGRNSGISTCAVTYGLGKKKELEEFAPDFIIDDICMLKEIII
jgi:phosphoglycolate phosphatase